MREPRFWDRDRSWQATVLAPAAALYGALTARRMQRPGRRVAVPVICIGNFHLGGAGKTPTALALGAALAQSGERPFVVSRGYGGALRGPLRVEPRHGAADVGDEPRMMAQHLPVVIARDRAAGADLALAQGASVILLDDGFQNPALGKDLSLIVVDGRRGLGNGAVFPAGPLRAPLEAQLPRSDALLVAGAGTGATGLATRMVAAGKPVFRIRLEAEDACVAALKGRACLAFAGIGDPDRFEATLASAGIDLKRMVAFDDHHRYDAAELERLHAQARRDGLTLVTTEKDLIRITSDPSLAQHAQGITAFRVRMILDADLLTFVRERIRNARSTALAGPQDRGQRNPE